MTTKNASAPVMIALQPTASVSDAKENKTESIAAKGKHYTASAKISWQELEKELDDVILYGQQNKQPPLTSLNISHPFWSNNITRKDTAVPIVHRYQQKFINKLENVLHHNPHIEVLTLKNQRLSASSCLEILQLVKNKKGLKHLDLSGNLDQDAPLDQVNRAVDLVVEIIQSGSLQFLALANNFLNKQQLEKIVNACNNNRSIRHLYLGGNLRVIPSLAVLNKLQRESKIELDMTGSTIGESPGIFTPLSETYLGQMIGRLPVCVDKVFLPNISPSYLNTFAMGIVESNKKRTAPLVIALDTNIPDRFSSFYIFEQLFLLLKEHKAYKIHLTNPASPYTLVINVYQKLEDMTSQNLPHLIDDYVSYIKELAGHLEARGKNGHVYGKWFKSGWHEKSWGQYLLDHGFDMTKLNHAYRAFQRGDFLPQQMLDCVNENSQLLSSIQAWEAREGFSNESTVDPFPTYIEIGNLFQAVFQQVVVKQLKPVAMMPLPNLAKVEATIGEEKLTVRDESPAEITLDFSRPVQNAIVPQSVDKLTLIYNPTFWLESELTDFIARARESAQKNLKILVLNDTFAPNHALSRNQQLFPNLRDIMVNHPSLTEFRWIRNKDNPCMARDCADIAAMVRNEQLDHHVAPRQGLRILHLQGLDNPGVNLILSALEADTCVLQELVLDEPVVYNTLTPLHDCARGQPFTRLATIIKDTKVRQPNFHLALNHCKRDRYDNDRVLGVAIATCHSNISRLSLNYTQINYLELAAGFKQAALSESKDATPKRDTFLQLNLCGNLIAENDFFALLDILTDNRWLAINIDQVAEQCLPYLVLVNFIHAQHHPEKYPATTDRDQLEKSFAFCQAAIKQFIAAIAKKSKTVWLTSTKTYATALQEQKFAADQFCQPDTSLDEPEVVLIAFSRALQAASLSLTLDEQTKLKGYINLARLFKTAMTFTAKPMIYPRAESESAEQATVSGVSRSQTVQPVKVRESKHATTAEPAPVSLYPDLGALELGSLTDAETTALIQSTQSVQREQPKQQIQTSAAVSRAADIDFERKKGMSEIWRILTEEAPDQDSSESDALLPANTDSPLGAISVREHQPSVQYKEAQAASSRRRVTSDDVHVNDEKQQLLA